MSSLLISTPFMQATLAQIKNPVYFIYENPVFGVRIAYPHNWYTEEDEFDPLSNDSTRVNLASFISPSEDDSYYPSVLDIEIGIAQNITLGEYLKKSIDDHKKDHSDFKIIESNTNATLGGYGAYKLRYAETRYPNTQYELLETGTIVDDKIYVITYHTKTSNYSAYLPMIQRMIDSFKIVFRIPNNFIPYQNPVFGIGLQYPSNWNFNQVEDLNITTAHFATISKGSNGFAAELQIAATYLPNSVTLGEYLKKSIDDHKKDHSDFKIIESNTNTKLAGKPAYWLTYTSKMNSDEDKNNQTDIKSTEVGSIINGRGYLITYNAVPARYSGYLQIVQKMIDSVRVFVPTALIQSPLTGSETINTAKTSNKFLTYYNSTYGPGIHGPSEYAVSIMYPSNWIKVESNDSNDDCLTQVVNFQSPSSDAQFVIYVQYLDAGEFQGLEDQVAWYIFYQYPGPANPFFPKKDNFYITSLNGNSTLASHHAYKLEYNQTVNGNKFTTLEIRTEVSGDVYFVTFDGQSAKYPYYLPIVQKMINSFKIEKPNAIKTTDYLSPYDISKISHFKCLGVGTPKTAPNSL